MQVRPKASGPGSCKDVCPPQLSLPWWHTPNPYHVLFTRRETITLFPIFLPLFTCLASHATPIRPPCADRHPPAPFFNFQLRAPAPFPTPTSLQLNGSPTSKTQYGLYHSISHFNYIPHGAVTPMGSSGLTRKELCLSFLFLFNRLYLSGRHVQVVNVSLKTDRGPLVTSRGDPP